jgi:hypothetical protein
LPGSSDLTDKNASAALLDPASYAMRESKRYADQEIREKAYIIVEELIQLYKMTNPEYGEKSEDNKLENARTSMSLFWELFDVLGYWAQCHLIAYKRSAVDAEFTTSVMEENDGLSSDSHVLEEIGDNFFKAIAADFSNPDFNYFDSEASYMSFQRRYSQLLRLFIFEILTSSSPESHPWRFQFQKALRAMNYGQTEELLKPMPIRKAGTPFALAEWKLEALLQIFYRVGQGMKKYRALEFVSEAIGQSTDTIRDWEKDAKFDEDYSIELQCAELAGRYSEKFKNIEKIPIGFPDHGTHRGRPLIEIAFDLAKIIEKRTFSEIAENILKFRQS